MGDVTKLHHPLSFSAANCSAPLGKGSNVMAAVRLRRRLNFVRGLIRASIHAPFSDCTFPCSQNTVGHLAVRNFQPECTIPIHPLDGWDDAVGAGAGFPLAVGLSVGGDHLFCGVGRCQARLVAADTVAFALGASFFVQSSTLDRSTEPVGFQACAAVATANLELWTPRFQRPGAGWCLAKRRMWCFCRSSRGWHSWQAVQSPAVAQRYPHRLRHLNQTSLGWPFCRGYPLSEEQRWSPQTCKPPLRLKIR